MKYHKVYIVDALRSPVGSFQGGLSSIPAPKLSSELISALLERISLDPAVISECILGSVLTAGQGQAPARQAAIFAGIPNSVPAYTVNKVCSSGLFSVILASRSIELGLSDVVVAGGMENMSQVPYYLPALRQGARLGNSQAVDGIVHDGLWDVYNNYHMGMAGELCAETFKLSREMQDEYALESYKRSQESISQGLFKNEIHPIKISNKKGDSWISEDEEPSKLKKDKVSGLKPVFKKDGTITAVNASSINDGAAALILCSENALKKYNLKARAKIISEGVFAQSPEWFTTAPVGALNKSVESAEIKLQDLAAVEINEAFSSVVLACTKELGLSNDLVNKRGGAVSMGHPIGASGARILVTLLSILESENKSTGAVSICNGGGEATSLVIQKS